MLSLVLLLCACVCVSAQYNYSANWPSINSRPLPGWYDQAKVCGAMMQFSAVTTGVQIPVNKNDDET